MADPLTLERFLARNSKFSILKTLLITETKNYSRLFKKVPYNYGAKKINPL